MDQRHLRGIESAAAMADLMEAAARATQGGEEPDPGLLTLAALIVAASAARRAQMTIGTWRALVRWVRLSLHDLSAPGAPAAPEGAAAAAARPCAPSAGATAGTSARTP